MSSKKCNHHWSILSTVNYESFIYDTDDGNYGFYVQDKTYECTNCFTKRVVTRMCQVSAKRKGNNYETNRIPDWFNIIEGLYCKSIYGDFFGCTAFENNYILHNRYLDYPEYPNVDTTLLKIDGKTVIVEKLIKY